VGERDKRKDGGRKREHGKEQDKDNGEIERERVGESMRERLIEREGRKRRERVR